MSKLKGLDGLFAGRHFDRDVIILCVRWYLRYKLSLRDLVEMMAERGLSLAHTTILRWVQRLRPSSSSAGTVSQHLRDGRGGLTRRTRISVANRFIYVGRWIGSARR
jgi:transposase-like protein